MLLYWWHGNRQQPGRVNTTISALETLPVLDFSDDWVKERMDKVKPIFDRFKQRSFQPAYRADVDETRAELDHAVLKWLGFKDESIHQAVRQLAHKWCAEPSVHGGKQHNKNTSFIS